MKWDTVWLKNEGEESEKTITRGVSVDVRILTTQTVRAPQSLYSSMAPPQIPLSEEAVIPQALLEVRYMTVCWCMKVLRTWILYMHTKRFLDSSFGIETEYQKISEPLYSKTLKRWRWNPSDQGCSSSIMCEFMGWWGLLLSGSDV